MSPPAAGSAGRQVVIRGPRVIAAGAPDPGASPADVLLEDGRIRQVAPDLPRFAGAESVDGGGLWLLPGWIDIQVNDIEWLAKGPRPPREHAARIREVLRYQAERGVTGLALATLAAPLDEVIAYLEGMRQALASPATPGTSALLGGLVEGTFMNPALSGAQNPRWVLPLDREVLERILGTQAVRLLNVAPEVVPDAIELIRHASSRGVIVGAGHAKPHARRLREAVEAGLRYIIHLGNGPTGSSLKVFDDGGMLEESLRNDRIMVSLIIDGVHIHPQLVRDWIARKEVSRVIATSDAGFAAGLPEAGFEVFGIRGAISPDGRYLMVLPQGGDGTASQRGGAYSSDVAALFGSAVGMREVFENTLNLLTQEMAGVYHRRHPALALDEAVGAASRMCAGNAAALLGLADRGEIAAGRRADAVLADIQGAPGAYRVKVQGTWCG